MPAEPASSAFFLDVSRTDGIALVRCSGRLVAGVTSSLHTEVKQLIPVSQEIILDLTDLEYMDSMGIGTVVRLYVSAKSHGCDLKLINLGKRVRELLGVTNLLSVFAVVGQDGVRIP
jgi:anti-sigma B factor antagonist